MIALSPDEWTAVHLSLRIALTATLVTLPLGIFAAYALARWRFPGKMLIDGLIHLPLVLPPVVTGYILLLLFGRRGPLGAPLAEYLGIVFSFRWTGAALAAAVMGFPLMVRPIRLSLEAIDRHGWPARRSTHCPRDIRDSQGRVPHTPIRPPSVDASFSRSP